MKQLAVLIVCLCLLGVMATPTSAQDPGPTPHPDEVNAIAKNLYCPVCANVPLDACGTAACIQWRQQIADLLSQGYSEQQIYDYFAQFGPSVLAAPPASGFNWLLYALPSAAILLGAFILWRRLGDASQKALNGKAAKHKTKYAKMIEDELKARR